MRVGIKGAQKNDPITKQIVGPKLSNIETRFPSGRSPLSEAWNYTSGTLLRTNQFHSDGIQFLGGVACVRVADTYFNWIMGQAVFCGSRPGDLRLPAHDPPQVHEHRLGACRAVELQPAIEPESS